MIRIRVNVLASLWVTLFAAISIEAAAEVTHTTHQATCTLANGDVKTLNMHIWYPDNQGGPYPLLVFAHGNLVGSPTQCPYLTKDLAANGYVVCATTHSNSVNSAAKPQGTDTAPGYLGLPLEVKAEIDEMLRLNRETGSMIYGMIDEDNIGVSGHSHGGWSTEVVCGAAPDELYVDKRVKAGFFLEPANAYGITGTPMAKEASANMHTASMWWFGTLDELVQPTINKFPYDVAPAPKYCAVVSGLDHFGAAMGSSGLNAITAEYALAFFNRYLKGDTSADAILQTTHSSFASYEYEAGPYTPDDNNDDGDDDDNENDNNDNDEDNNENDGEIDIEENLDGTTTTIETSYTLADGTTKPLRITVWYPQTTNGNNTYPLVVFSHGALMGYAAQSTYITAGLAREGYIVCATTHEDSTYYQGEKDTSPLTQGYWDRPLDVQAIITEMLRLNNSPQSAFYRTINEQAIGVMGHSYGGWTSEVIGGAVTAEQQAYADPRTKAAVLFAPANHRMTEGAAGNIRVPTLFLFAENDTLASPSANKFAYDCAPAPKYAGILSDFGHFDFADMGRGKPQADVVTRYTIAFFNKYLKNNSSGEQTLLDSDPLFVSYEYDLGAGGGSPVNTAATNTTENTEQNSNTTTRNSNSDSGNSGNNQGSLLSNKSLANCPIVNALKQMQQKSQNGDNTIGKTGSLADTFKKRMEGMKNTSLNDKIKEVKDKIGGIFEGKGTILDDKLNNIFTAQENRPTDKLADLFTNDTGSNLDKMNTSRLFEKMKNISPNKNILTMVNSLKDTAKLSSNTTTSNNSSLSGSSSNSLTSFTTGIMSTAKQGLSSLKLGSGSPLVTGLFGQGLGKLSTFNFGLLSGKLRQ